MTIIPGRLKTDFQIQYHRYMYISSVNNLSGPPVKNSLPYVQYIKMILPPGIINYISMFDKFMSLGLYYKSPHWKRFQSVSMS